MVRHRSCDCLLFTRQRYFDKKHAVVFTLSFVVSHSAFGRGDPGFAVTDAEDARVAERRVVFGHEQKYRFAAGLLRYLGASLLKRRSRRATHFSRLRVTALRSRKLHPCSDGPRPSRGCRNRTGSRDRSQSAIRAIEKTLTQQVNRGVVRYVWQRTCKHVAPASVSPVTSVTPHKKRPPHRAIHDMHDRHFVRRKHLRPIEPRPRSTSFTLQTQTSLFSSPGACSQQSVCQLSCCVRTPPSLSI